MLIINEITTLIDSLCVESTQVVLDNLKGERLHQGQFGKSLHFDCFWDPSLSL